MTRMETKMRRYEMNMADIVERLESRIHDAPMPSEHLMDEAANEIKQLRSDAAILDKAVLELRKEWDRLRPENEQLRAENDTLRSCIDLWTQAAHATSAELLHWRKLINQQNGGRSGTQTD